MIDTADNSLPIVRAVGLRKSYGKGAGRVHVLRGLDLEVARGELLAVMGPSGCGKSTLLHVLGLMTPPDSGELMLAGEVVGRGNAQRTRLRRRKIGFVFQRFNLLPMISGVDNVRISLRSRGIRPDGQADALLDRLGVAHVARRKPGEMSIGEQQRVAVARALAHEPDLLLADEPTGNLDSASTDELLNLLCELNRDRAQTIVMITHSADVAERAGRIVRMKDGTLPGDALER